MSTWSYSLPDESALEDSTDSLGFDKLLGDIDAASDATTTTTVGHEHQNSPEPNFTIEEHGLKDERSIEVSSDGKHNSHETEPSFYPNQSDATLEYAVNSSDFDSSEMRDQVPSLVGLHSSPKIGKRPTTISPLTQNEERDQPSTSRGFPPLLAAGAPKRGNLTKASSMLEKSSYRPALLRRQPSIQLTLPLKHSNPRPGISIDDLFVGTKRAPSGQAPLTRLEANNSSSELQRQEVSSTTERESSPDMVIHHEPTYRAIFSREARKKVNVFGDHAPELVDLKFSFDNNLRHMRHNSKEFKELAAKIKVGLTLKHGETTWKVNKSFDEIVGLHRSLLAERAKSKMWQFTHPGSDRYFPDLPNVSRLSYTGSEPDTNNSFGDGLSSFQDQLLLYLKMLIAFYFKDSSLCRFLQCSFYSFIDDLGSKSLETTVRGRRTRHEKIFCRRSFQSAGWLVQKDSCVLHVIGSRIIDVLLVDRAFEVEKLSLNRLRVRSLSQTSDYKVYNQQLGPWYESLTRLKNSCEYSRASALPNTSFAPERPHSRCLFFIDGFKYFQSLYHALMSAREEIFITDWWLTAHYYLIRKYDPEDEHKMDAKYRLDNVLAAKAEEGVRIYVLLYNEIQWAVGLQSKHTKKVLTSLHPNIKVMRHPYLGTLLWAHHEKIVVIDQLIAYVGGIDICLGRWDDMMHRLTDTGGSDAQPIDHNVSRTLRQNARHLFMRMNKESVAGFKNRMKRKMTARSMGLPRKFVRRKRGSRHAGSLTPILDEESVASTVPSRPTRGVLFPQNSHDSAEDAPDTPDNAEEDEQPDQYLWVGQDYVNIILKDHTDVSRPFEMVIDRDTTPRMPWHDIASVVYGKCARDVARHFIQRWNMIKSVYKSRKLRFFRNVKNFNYPYLVPKSTNNITSKSFKHLHIEKESFLATCQVVRSIGAWSGGFAENYCERSIYEAYMNIIDKAEHYIYIENQFFVSSTNYGGIVLFNKIVSKIEERIIRAHRKPAKPKFRVYIVLPLVPGFPGQIGQTGHAVPQKIQNWMYRTLSQGDDCLFKRLTSQGVPVTDYVTVCGLRTHGMLKDKLVTEIIFVHDKIMIVDDKVAIIGSANINDRSLMGERDSEVAVVFRDEEFIESQMDGQPYAAGRFCWGFRQKLWKEHLLVLDDKTFPDPVSDEFFKSVWTATAARNTKIYEEVFNAVPSDTILTFSELRDHLKKGKLAEENKDEAQLKLAEVQGYLVLFPTQYLRHEDIGSLKVNFKAFAPERLWC